MRLEGRLRRLEVSLSLKRDGEMGALTDGWGVGSTAAGLKVLEEGKVMESYMEALRTTTFKTSRLDDPKD